MWSSRAISAYERLPAANKPRGAAAVFLHGSEVAARRTGACHAR